MGDYSTASSIRVYMHTLRKLADELLCFGHYRAYKEAHYRQYYNHDKVHTVCNIEAIQCHDLYKIKPLLYSSLSLPQHMQVCHDKD